MGWFELVILALACQRVTTLWFAPGLFFPVREYLAKSSALLRLGVNCPLCISCWSAALLYILLVTSTFGYAAVAILAIGAAANIVNTFSR